MARQTTRTHIAVREQGAAPGAVQLAWALDRHRRKVRAARIAPADRRARAPFTCLACGEELIPHLGRIRTPHFAHRAGSACPLTAPETALHLDCKERLLALCEDAFAGRRRLVARARCPQCRRVQPVDVGALGDRAVGEGAVGALRADVLVLSGERPAFALEVKVTHAVEPAKEAALVAAGVPTVELDAREEWEREGDDLVELVCARSFAFAPCPACQVRARARVERDQGGEAAEIAELEEYRARGLLRAAGRKAGRAGPDDPLNPQERAELAREFRCPECGGTSLLGDGRIVRHVCDPPGDSPIGRPVAWRGYDGSCITLGWWSRRALPGPSADRKPR